MDKTTPMKTILAILLLIPSFIFAGEVTLQWDASDASEPVSGYEVSYGEAAGAWTQRWDAGNALTVTITGLARGKTFYFIVRAYNSEGFSPPSNEVFARIFGVPGAPQQLRITAKKLAELDDKLRVQKQHYVQFKQGVAPNYPTRILKSRGILDLSMNPKDATLEKE
jgi:hypothetical protein